QRADRVRGEEFARGAPRRGLGRHRLHAVLAELEGGMRVAVRPGAARAVEAMRLVGTQQGPRTLAEDALAAQGPHRGGERVQAAGGLVVGLVYLVHDPCPTEPCRPW